MADSVASGPMPAPGVLRALEALSILETVSLAGLFVNLLTVHLRPVAAVLGPTHGALYLSVAVVALLARGLLTRTRSMALIPVLGGVLTLWNIRVERRRRRVVAAPTDDGMSLDPRVTSGDSCPPPEHPAKGG